MPCFFNADSEGFTDCSTVGGRDEEELKKMVMASCLPSYPLRGWGEKAHDVLLLC